MSSAKKKAKGETVYGVIEKGASTRIFVQPGTFNNMTMLHIREHYLDDAGEWKPTKKGVTLREVDQIDVLIKALKAARDDF